MPQRDQMMPQGKRQELQSGAEYSVEEEDFIRAMESYMRLHKCRFPSFTDVLRVAKSLGYRKADTEE